MPPSLPIYQHPLAYLLGLEGLALLRGWAGDVDRTYTRARLDEIRRLLDDPRLSDHPGVDVQRNPATTGYRQWAASYDEPNGLFDIDEPFIVDILDRLPPGRALDAACGTGRLASLLAARGHRVSGVDESPEMLAAARRRLPEATFREGTLDRLPVPDGSFEVVVCGLALSHVRLLGPVFTEFARVLTPGGRLIVTDVHAELVFRGSVVNALGEDGSPGLVDTHRHSVADYLRAALAAGFTALNCAELDATEGADGPPEPPAEADPDAQAHDLDVALTDWSMWPWTLLAEIPEAVRVAWTTPSVIAWHFRRG